MDHAIPINLWHSPWVHHEFVKSDEPSICLDGVPYTMATLLLAALRDLWMPGHRCLILDLGHDLLPELRALMARIGVAQVSELGWKVDGGGLLWLVENKNSAAAYDNDWDCIIVDQVDELGSRELGRLVRHLRANGRLRTARGTTHTESLLGRKVRASGMLGPSVPEEIRLRNTAFAAVISFHSADRWRTYSSGVRERNIVEAIDMLQHSGDRVRHLGSSAAEFGDYVLAFADGFRAAADGTGGYVLIACDANGCEEGVGAQVQDGAELSALFSKMRDQRWSIENVQQLGCGLVLCPGHAGRKDDQIKGSEP